jgi:multidrug resistance efflux pump
MYGLEKEMEQKVKQAEAKVEEAEAKVEEANAKAEEANAKAEEANAKAEEAEAKLKQKGIDTARKLKAMNVMAIDQIADITGLSIKEIEAL